MTENTETNVERQLRELREACGYSDGEDGEETGVDSLIDYKNELEDAYACLLEAFESKGASITFGGEASESFANMLQHIETYTVEVIPETGEPFDAVVVGSASDTTGDYYGVRVRRFDDNLGEPIGEPFDVVVRELRLY